MPRIYLNVGQICDKKSGIIGLQQQQNNGDIYTCKYKKYPKYKVHVMINENYYLCLQRNKP